MRLADSERDKRLAVASAVRTRRPARRDETIDLPREPLHEDFIRSHYLSEFQES